MSKMPYLWFVTLNTGAAEKTASPAADATHLAMLDLARALRDGRSPIARQAGYEIEALTISSALLCTIWQGALPIATIGVARRSIGSQQLWDALHAAAYPLETDPSTPPQVPWCGVRIEPTAILAPNPPWAWLATYELEIAWAWVERKRDD